MRFHFPIIIIDEDFRSENTSGFGIRALAKAIEAISGQATVFDVIAYGETQKSALAQALTQALAALEAQLATEEEHT